MGRKKKNKDNNEGSQLDLIETGKEKLKRNITGDAKRSAVAVFLFALSVVIILGFFNQSGVLGKSLGNGVGLVMGWAKFVFPLFLIMAGIVLLLRKTPSFYITKLIGLGITFLSLTGFFHWFYDLDQMVKIADKGEGGGYIGYAVSYLLVLYLGNWGGLVVVLAFLIIGIIVAFNFSIVSLGERFFSKEKTDDQGENDLREENPQEITDGNQAHLAEKPEGEKVVDPENNIAKIEFVEGADRFVSSNLSSDMIGPSVRRINNKSLERNDPSRKSRKKGKWQLPPFDLLERSSGGAKGGDVERNAEIIENTLRTFGIEVERGEIQTGPAVTQYSFRPAVGVKISKILALQNDLALALAAHPIRIEAPIPGKSLIGIEVPNKVSAIVRLRDILESKDFRGQKSKLTLALGEDVSGNFVFSDLAKMPHLMIAGATGTGKSVSINTLITSLLYQNSPEDLRLIMVDPKRVELSLYNKIPHLLSDVIVDNNKVVNVLKWAVGEMEKRYRLLQDAGSRDIVSYQEKVSEGVTKKYQDPSTGETVEEELEKLPYIVIIIDELADLMGSHGKEVEGAIVRLAQMARAVGIHLIVSTQRPSVEVITGLIKANITTRISFQVATQIDSRTILDMGGAEKLLGNGDMLFLSAASPKPKRIQGVYVSENEVKKVVKFIKDQKTEEEEEQLENDITAGEKNNSPQNILEFKESAEKDNGDDLFEAAKEEVIRAKKASASLLQRRLRVGYARAARLIDILEEKGVVGPADGAKPREVYAAVPGPAEVDYADPVEDQSKRDKWEM